jgi:hypothetical protein
VGEVVRVVGVVVVELLDPVCVLAHMPVRRGAVGRRGEDERAAVAVLVEQAAAEPPTTIRLSRIGGRFLAEVERIYEELENEWAAMIGERRLTAIRTGLTVALAAKYGSATPPVRPAL